MLSETKCQTSWLLWKPLFKLNVQIFQDSKKKVYEKLGYPYCTERELAHFPLSFDRGKLLMCPERSQYLYTEHLD